MEENQLTGSILSQENYFCYLSVRNHSTAYLGFAQIALGLILMFFTFRHYRSLSKVTSIPKNMKFIYLSIFAQILLQLTQMALCEIIYWIYRNKQQIQWQIFAFYSKIIFLFDVVQVFTMEGLIILVCYNWMERVIILLQRLAELETQYELQNQSQTVNILKFEKKSRKIIGFYLILRILFFSVLIATIVLASNNPTSIHLHMVSIIVLVQTFIVIVLLSISIYAISKNSMITEIVDKQEIKRLVNQYLILLICCLIKFVVGFYEVLNLNQQDFNVQCILDPDATTTQIVSFIAVGSIFFIFNYYLPTCFILRIFDLSPNYKVSESLLINDPTGSGTYEDIIRS